MKTALQVIAELVQVDIDSAFETVRRNPLIDEEIHIDEELINLEEALAMYKTAGPDLKRYPRVRKHMIHEQYLILKHSIGLIARMLQNRRLPRKYSPKDTEFALTRLVRLLVDEALRAGKRLDEDVLDVFRPFLSIRQRVRLGEWHAISTRLYMRMAIRRITSLSPVHPFKSM